MRSRSRVIDIMRTVNPRLYPMTAARMLTIADHLSVPGQTLIKCEAGLDWLYEMATRSESEHIRDLALDGLHYWTERI